MKEAPPDELCPFTAGKVWAAAVRKARAAETRRKEGSGSPSGPKQKWSTERLQKKYKSKPASAEARRQSTEKSTCAEGGALGKPLKSETLAPGVPEQVQAHAPHYTRDCRPHWWCIHDQSWQKCPSRRPFCFCGSVASFRPLNWLQAAWERWGRGLVIAPLRLAVGRASTSPASHQSQGSEPWPWQA